VKTFSLLLLLLLTVPLAAVRSENSSGAVTRYSVLLGDRIAGTQESVCEGGECTSTFQYDDRGRGPRLVSRVTVDDQQVPTLVETSGYDYFKSRVGERFAYDGARAFWSNREEHGERPLERNRFYVSVTGVPEETGLLARALLAAPQGKLALLPEGEARIEKMSQLQVRNSSDSRTVVLYAISGLDFTDSPVWLDQDNEFFGVMRSNLSVVRAGWESALPAMRKAQEAASTAHATALAHLLGHQPAGPLVFQGANLFDAETATVRPNTTVVVTGNRITAVGPDGSVAIPAGAEFINARGKTLLPGLWDMHAHLNEMDGPLNLAAGVTTTRDLGNEVDKVMRLRRRFDSGEALGPRVVLAGLMDAPGPNHGPTDVLVGTESEARAAVARFAGLGYEQVKVYSSISPRLLPAIIDEARKRHLLVGGHVPAFMTAEQGVRLGMGEINHIDYLLLNFLSGAVLDTRRPARFTTVALHGGEIDMRSQPVRDLIALLQQQQVVIDPTLNIFENMLNGRSGELARGFVPVADRLPPQVRRGALVSGLPVPAGMDQRYRDSFTAMLNLVRELYRAGVTIVAGTDSLGGFPLQRELELYVQAGIPAPEVLRIATLGAARVMHHDRELGSIVPGKLADLALIDGDPASNISDIRHVVTTVKNGVVYQAASLYQAVGVAAR